MQASLKWGPAHAFLVAVVREICLYLHTRSLMGQRLLSSMVYSSLEKSVVARLYNWEHASGEFARPVTCYMR